MSFTFASAASCIFSMRDTVLLPPERFAPAFSLAYEIFAAAPRHF
jgi:hypothetical protein